MPRAEFEDQPQTMRQMGLYELDPQAAPVDTYVKPAHDASAGKDLESLAQALQGFSGALDGMMAKQEDEAKQAAIAQGQEAFYTQNKDGLAQASGSGLIPVQANPWAMRSYNDLQGQSLGNDIQTKWQQAWDQWDGKNYTGPDAFQKFQDFRSNFVKSMLPQGQIDPYLWKGLQPRLSELYAATNNQFTKNLHDTVTTGAATTLGTTAIQDGDTFYAAGAGQGGATNYGALFANMQANRQKAIDSGLLNPDDATAAMDRAAANLAVKYKDTGFLDWFNQKEPGKESTYGQSPTGIQLYDQTNKSVLAAQKADMGQAAELHNQQMKAEREQVTSTIQQQLAQNPSGPVDPALLQRADTAGFGDIRTKINEWRNSFQDSSAKSDPDSLRQVYQDMVKAPDSAVSIASSAFNSGAIRGASDFVAANTFAKGLKQNGEGVTAILNDSSAKQIEDAISQKTQGSTQDAAGNPVPFDRARTTAGGFAAIASYEQQLAEWKMANPNASVIEQRKAIFDIGQSVMKNISEPAPGQGGQYQPPPTDTSAFAGQVRDSQAAAKATADKAAQDKQIQDLEAQRPNFIAGLFGGNAAKNAEIDAKEQAIRGQGQPQAPATPPQGPTPSAADTKAWMQHLPRDQYDAVMAQANTILQANPGMKLGQITQMLYATALHDHQQANQPPAPAAAPPQKSGLTPAEDKALPPPSEAAGWFTGLTPEQRGKTLDFVNRTHAQDPSLSPADIMRRLYGNVKQQQSGAPAQPATPSVGAQASAGDGATQAAAYLRHFEGFRDRPYWDVNHWRIGYGSDTITRADGSVEPVTAMSSITREDGERDLQRRVAQTQAAIKNSVGDATWNALDPATQAAVSSVAYNYGHLPNNVVEAVKGGNKEAIAAAVHGLPANPNRRAKEANAVLGKFGLSGVETTAGGHVAEGTPIPTRPVEPTLGRHDDNVIQIQPATQAQAEQSPAERAAPQIAIDPQGIATIRSPTGDRTAASPEAIHAAILAGARRLRLEGDQPTSEQKATLIRLTHTLRHRFSGLNFVGLGGPGRPD